ncbi:MAG: Lrp/AsnC family transcriptional regulator [Methylococcales bacterium]|nr:Lrp/AsnC family transcriptional regulator [Methylococcales bacterium]
MSLTLLQKKLLNDFQRNFPLSPTPYADIATTLNVTEAQVLQAFQELSKQAAISRIGAIIPPNQIGVSTLAAMSVPKDESERVALQVNHFREVNHNYERENAMNLWFVVIANDVTHLDSVINDIEATTGYKVLRFPLEKEFFIDLSFNLDLANA